MTYRTVLGIMGALALGAGLGACGGGDDDEDTPDNVNWTCQCSWVRDGVSESGPYPGGCGSSSDAQAVVQAQGDQCTTDLASVCTDATLCEPCSCTCSPGEACTPI